MAVAWTSGLFTSICLLHSTVAVTCGALMMFYLNEISVSKTRPRDDASAAGISAARPAADRDLRLLRRPAALCHWPPPLHGRLQGLRLPGLLRQGMSPRVIGNFSECRLAALLLLEKEKEKCLQQSGHVRPTSMPKLQGRLFATESFFYTSKHWERRWVLRAQPLQRKL
ncbi:putative apyrase 6 [Canna indica]|uniref:Apyrase 6 n=1 Tax=Canna indica TaxID=4628 RepID=A0AAQ3KK93_9LILI|nr:putative apyrase 6 [Canna indica]